MLHYLHDCVVERHSRGPPPLLREADARSGFAVAQGLAGLRF